jgi:hypothetical protein
VRLLVVGSCGKRKLHYHTKQPSCLELIKHPDIEYWRKKLPEVCAPAREIYTGPQNTELVKAVDLLRKIPNVKVQLVIVSAGFGILQEHDLVPPYDCSFTNMKLSQIRERTQILHLKSSFSSLTSKGFDLIYLALGKRYLDALGDDVSKPSKIPTVTFQGEETKQVTRISCSADVVKAFSKQGHKIHGVVGFKGDLLRLLAKHALEKPHPYAEVKKWVRQSYLKILIHQLGGLSE